MTTSSQRTVERFRRLTGKRKVAPVSFPPAPAPHETAIIIGVVLTWTVALFLRGGFHWWAMLPTAICALVTFLMVLIPPGQPRDERHKLRRKNVRALVRFPVFWLGLLLLLVVWIQSVNVWQHITFHGGTYQFVFPDFWIPWLPHGIVTNLEADHPFLRGLLFFSPWAITCSIWVGLRDCRGLAWLWAGVLAVGLLWLAVGYLGYIMEWQKAMGLWFSPSGILFSSYINVTHASFVCLGLLAICLSLGYRLWRSYLQRMRMSGPHWMLWPLMPVCLLPAIFTTSIAPLALMLGLIVCFACLIIGRAWVLQRVTSIVFLLLLSAMLALSVLWFLGPKGFYLRKDLERLEEQGTQMNSWASRLAMNDASWAAFKDRPAFGWGTGGYRYLMPQYLDPAYFANRGAKRVEDPTHPRGWRWQRTKKSPLRAHNDYLQFLAEMGWIGVLPWMGILLFWLVKVITLSRHLAGDEWLRLLALGLLAAAGWWDFVYQGLGLHVLMCVLLVTSLLGGTQRIRLKKFKTA